MSDQLSSDLESLRIVRGADLPPPEARRWPLWAAAGAAAVGIVYFVIIPAVRRTVFKTQVEITEVISASPVRASVLLTASGYVVPQRISKVGAKITGRIARMYVKEGDSVKEGDLLAELEDAQERSSITVSQARASSAEARVRTAEAQLAEAEQQMNRQQRLAEQGVAAQATVDDLITRRDSLKAARDAARAEMDAVRAEVGAQQTTLSYMKITAPLTGVVIGKPAEPGELVGVMAASIAEVADMNSLMVEVDVPERRLSQVVIGNPCEAVLDAFPNRRLRCKVHEISRRIDRAKATVIVKAAFVDDPTGVLPDMSAHVGFLNQELPEEARHAADEILVPKSAIAGGPGNESVYVIRDGKARSEKIRVGEDRGEYFILEQGPPPGTRIINNPPPGLADGHPVKETQE